MLALLWCTWNVFPGTTVFEGKGAHSTNGDLRIRKQLHLYAKAAANKYWVQAVWCIGAKEWYFRDQLLTSVSWVGYGISRA